MGSVGHGEQAPPQLAVRVFETHAPLHRWKPAAQAEITQAVPEQLVDVPFGSVGHRLHAPWHCRKPELHCSPHEVPSHTAIPLGSVAHGLQLPPHDETEVLETH